jgi:hypothetical protein
MIKRLSPETMKRRRGAYLRACLQHDRCPADAVVLKLFSDLQLAAWARQHSPQNREVAKAFERQVWDHLMHYLMTFERPELPSFNRLEKWPGRRSLRGVIKDEL